MLLPLQSQCRSRFSKKESEGHVSIEELQLSRMGLGGSDVFPWAPCVSCFVSSLLHVSSTGPLSRWSPLCCSCTDHTVKLSLVIARRTAKQVTAYFTKLSQVHHCELCVPVPRVAPIFPPLELCRAVGVSFCPHYASPQLLSSSGTLYHKPCCAWLACCAAAEDVAFGGVECSEACCWLGCSITTFPSCVLHPI